ncbi:glycosyltransferase family 2 protein [Sulfurimonas sediminis]|uniref:Glycosyltransferase family 2 protein n=1 Tax=Sulfurimonas sediminis TaxID=2590020 RepID=A0A7M1AZA6_9BACT|nr:glycosyltransferase family 2 protein [Sulfurimonas sediminis]QOP42636.1 glycosyltransferase family 2 protein [Sulfurimonas sediminis]
MKKTVAVLMATCNGEKYLKQQLDSIFSQTYQNFKLYISDDCSEDATIKIVQTYTDRYPEKITYTINEKNRGFVKNFEKLLSDCQEEYIALADQDDIWQPNKLELLMNAVLQLEALRQNSACLIHSDLSLIDQDGNQLHQSYFQFRHYKLKNSKDLGHILGPCGVMGNTLLLNKKLKKIVLPFPEQLDVHDYWIALHAELFGQRKTLHTQLVHYRIHNENSSNNAKTLRRNRKNKYFHRDFKLPYLETNRKYFLKLLLPKITNQKDSKTLKAFLKYLDFNHPGFLLYYHLIRYSLVKRDIIYRIKLLFKILLTKRYDA